MTERDQLLLRHIVLPAALTLLFFVNAALPVTVLGCANRGLVAIIVAIISILAALFSAIMAMKRTRSTPRINPGGSSALCFA